MIKDMKRRTALTLLLLLTLVACGKPDQPTIPLYQAVHQGDLNQLKRHIAWGAELNRLEADGQAPLHVTSALGDMVLTRLLLKNGADPNLDDKQGHAALWHALVNGRTQVAQLLIDQGAEFKAQEMLREVILQGVGDRDVFRFLVARGADLDQPFSDGDTPLTLAVGRGDRVVSKLLIAQGANVNKASESGKLPLAIARDAQRQDLVRMLENRGAISE